MDFIEASEAPPYAPGLAEELRVGLEGEAKRLPCRLLYDEAGSQIFEEICDLPEYYLTRAERSILVKHAHEIAASVPDSTRLVELGSGSASKTRLLIEALLRRRDSLTFVPIDISTSALEESAEPLLEDFPDLEILAVAGEYESGLANLRSLDSAPHLILWLGSSVGNLDRADAEHFLGNLSSDMDSDDRFLLGVDLRKDRGVLERAYDDSQGVTARFNFNLLTRINRELGGEFDVSAFDFRAVYREEPGVVQSYLVSRVDQRVRIEGLDLEVSLAAGEEIHTEDSFKYSPDEIATLCDNAGMAIERRWLDDDARFTLAMLAPAD